MGFPRQEYWSGLPFSSPGDLPDPGIKPGSPALQADALTSEPPGKPTFVGSSKKQENSGKTSNSALLTAKAFDFVDHNKLWNSLKEMEYQTSSSASWEICMQVKKQQLELDMEQKTGSKLGKEYIKAVHCHPAYLTYRQSTVCEMIGWMKHKLESRLQGEI